MRVELPCGHEKIDLDIPNNAMVLEPLSMPTLHDPEGAVTSALEQPIDSPPLSELAAGRKNVCIVISDNTRPVPNRVILPPLLKTLQSAGIDRHQITSSSPQAPTSPMKGKSWMGLSVPGWQQTTTS